MSVVEWPDPVRDIDWYERADAEIYVLAGEGRQFTATELVDRVGTPIGSQNQIGALFRSASSRRIIVPVMAAASTRRSRHGALVRIWVGAEHAVDGAA